jgi:hypothetical protein
MSPEPRSPNAVSAAWDAVGKRQIAESIPLRFFMSRTFAAMALGALTIFGNQIIILNMV